MSPERTGGPPPIEPGGGRTNPNTKAEREAKQKVEKVREVDPDEQTKQQRRNKFQSFLNAPAEDQNPPQRAPSPFETAFYNAPASPAKRTKDATQDEAIPTPGMTAPPDLTHPTFVKNKEEEKSLPQSKTFWTDTDLPPDHPLPHPTFKEKTEKSKELSFQTPKTKEAKPAGAPFVPVEKNKGPAAPRLKKEKEAPLAPERPKEGMPLAPKPPRDLVKEPARKKDKAAEQEVPVVAQLPKEREGKGGQQQHQDKKGHKAIEVDLSALAHAPHSIRSIAQTATQQAASYLHPENATLFYQMVGTIYLSMPPGSGINQTVIVLNQAAFSGSKFFGATITIEKYATAPDALNIRLTGSNQAVVAFRDNIPSLMNAFQNSNLPFKVNRIDVEFAPERPLFHRKGQKKGGDLEGGMGEDRRR